MNDCDKHVLIVNINSINNLCNCILYVCTSNVHIPYTGHTKQAEKEVIFFLD